MSRLLCTPQPLAAVGLLTLCQHLQLVPAKKRSISIVDGHGLRKTRQPTLRPLKKPTTAALASSYPYRSHETEKKK